MSSQEPHGSQQVDDPGEYNQRLRIQEIAEARKTARLALMSSSEDGPQEQLDAFHAVQAFATELEWLIRDQGGDKYFDRHLGNVTISAPLLEEFEPKNKTSMSRDVERLFGSSIEDGETPFYGLYNSDETGAGFIDHGGVVSEIWEKNGDVKHNGSQDVVAVKEKHIPVEISMRANRLCREFVHEAGLDAKIESEVDEDPNPV